MANLDSTKVYGDLSVANNLKVSGDDVTLSGLVTIGNASSSNHGIRLMSIAGNGNEDQTGLITWHHSDFTFGNIAASGQISLSSNTSETITVTEHLGVLSDAQINGTLFSAGSIYLGGNSDGSKTMDNGKAIILGDDDTGMRQNGDGVLEFWSNNQMRFFINSSRLQLNHPIYANDGSSTIIDADGSNLYESGTALGNKYLKLAGGQTVTGKVIFSATTPIEIEGGGGQTITFLGGGPDGFDFSDGTVGTGEWYLGQRTTGNFFVLENSISTSVAPDRIITIDDSSVVGAAITINNRDLVVNGALSASSINADDITIGTLSEDRLPKDLTGRYYINHAVANEAALIVARRIDDASNTPALIVANDGENSDVIAEFRAAGSGTSVDVGDAANSSHTQVQIMGDGTVKANSVESSGYITTGNNRYSSNGGLYGINLGNSDIIGINSLMFADDSNATSEGLLFPETGTTFDATDPATYNSLRINSTGVPIFANKGNEYELIHSGGNQVINKELKISGVDPELVLSHTGSPVNTDWRWVVDNNGHMILQRLNDDSSWNSTKLTIHEDSGSVSVQSTGVHSSDTIHAPTFSENGTELIDKYFRFNTLSSSFGYHYFRRNDSNNPPLYANQRGNGDIARFFKGPGDTSTSSTTQVVIRNNADVETTGQFIEGGTALVDKYAAASSVTTKPIFVTDTSSSSGVWSGTSSEVTSLYDGLIVWFINSQSGISTGTTFNLNNTGAVDVYTRNTNRLTTHYGSNSLIMMAYSSSLNGGCWVVHADYNSTESYTSRWNNDTVLAGTQLHGYQLLMEGVDGKFYPVTEGGVAGNNTNTVSTVEFRIGGQMLNYNSATDVAAGGTVDTTYESVQTGAGEYWMNYAAGSGWATPRLPFYLVGSINANGNFVLDNSTPTAFITQTLPTSEDGKVYLQVGWMIDGDDTWRLSTHHPRFIYKNGSIRLLGDASDAVTETGNHTITGNITLTGDTTFGGQIAWDTSKNLLRFSKTFSINSYWEVDEYLEIATITPGGGSRNYYCTGRVVYGGSAEANYIDFQWSVRSNTLPALSSRFRAQFITKQHSVLGDFVEWYDSTNGVIKLLLKHRGNGAAHNAHVSMEFNNRGNYTSDIDFSNRSEITVKPAEFVETLHATYEVITAGGGQTIWGDMNVNGTLNALTIEANTFSAVPTTPVSFLGPHGTIALSLDYDALGGSHTKFYTHNGVNVNLQMDLNSWANGINVAQRVGIYNASNFDSENDGADYWLQYREPGTSYFDNFLEIGTQSTNGEVIGTFVDLGRTGSHTSGSTNFAIGSNDSGQSNFIMHAQVTATGSSNTQKLAFFGSNPIQRPIVSDTHQLYDALHDLGLVDATANLKEEVTLGQNAEASVKYNSTSDTIDFVFF